MLIYAKNKGFDDEKVDHMFEHFCNNARQNDRKCKDWKAAWRNWVLKEIDMNGDPKVDPYDELFRDYKKDDSDVIDLNGRR